MKIASQMCEERFSRDIYQMFTDNFTDSKILATINNLAPKFDDTMEFCRFSEDESGCRKYLFPIITEEGLCYVFNALNINEVTTDE